MRNPRPSGEYASTLTPSSLHASRTPFFSMVSSHGEYSTSTKSTVATFAARRSVSAEHSERPMNLVLPSLRTASSARIVSSIGLSGGARGERGQGVTQAAETMLDARVLVDPMQEVRIGVQATEELNAAVDRADHVLGRACERETGEDRRRRRDKAARDVPSVDISPSGLISMPNLEIRKTWTRGSSAPTTRAREQDRSRKPHLLAVVTLAQDLADEALVFSQPVHECCVPNGAALHPAGKEVSAPSSRGQARRRRTISMALRSVAFDVSSSCSP